MNSWGEERQTNNISRFVKGLEAGLTGACKDEERTLFLGPDLAYGAKGKSDGYGGFFGGVLNIW